MQSATLQPTAETPSATSHGLAELLLEHRDGRTRLTHARTRPPLLVQRALYPDDSVPDLAHVFLSNPTGGLFAGDRQDVKVGVGRGARAHVTTQSATKIYTMEHGKAEQCVALSVAAGGYLEYLPDPLIPFRDASLQQDFSITVEPDGTLLWWDVITPGRVAMGEAFQYRGIRSRLAVYRAGNRPVYREAFDLCPSAARPTGIGLLGMMDEDSRQEGGDFTLGSMLIVCDEDIAGRVLDSLREALRGCINTQAGASLLPDGNGVGLKVVGADCSAVRSTMVRAWSIARQELIGIPSTLNRKY